MLIFRHPRLQDRKTYQQKPKNGKLHLSLDFFGSRAVLISKGNAMGVMRLSVSDSCWLNLWSKKCLQDIRAENVFLGKIHESFDHPQQKQVHHAHRDQDEFAFPCSSELRTIPAAVVYLPTLLSPWHVDGHKKMYLQDFTSWTGVKDFPNIEEMALWYT